MKYIIARYNFDSLFKQDADNNFLNDIQLDPIFRARTYSFAIGHVTAEGLGDIEIIRGQIGRIPKEEEGYVYNTNEKDFIARDKGEFADIILDFCIIPSKHLLLIQQDSQFRPETALNRFKDIYLQSNQSYVSSFTVDFIFDEQNVYEEIAHWERFTKISFKDLRPSNPDPNDDYAFIEDLLKDMGGDKTNLESSIDSVASSNISKDSTINVESRLVKEALALSAHGYGRGEITGVDEGGEEKNSKNI